MTMAGEHPWRATLQERAPRLVPIVGKCLQADRKLRYASVIELVNDLAPYGSKASRDSAARIRRAMPSAVPEVEPTIDVVSPRSDAASSRHSPPPQTADIRIVRPWIPWRTPASIAIVAACGVVAAILFGRPSRRGDIQPVEAPIKAVLTDARVHPVEQSVSSARATLPEVVPQESDANSPILSAAVLGHPVPPAHKEAPASLGTHPEANVHPDATRSSVDGGASVTGTKSNYADASFRDLPDNIVRSWP